jgi:hypothetical protein
MRRWFSRLSPLPVAAFLALALPALACTAEPVDDAESSEDDLVASFDKSGKVDLAKPTHILLVGDSDKLGSMPLYAALGRGRRYTQLYPNDQVVLFVTQDVKATDVTGTGTTVLKDEPFGDVKLADLSRLSADKLVAAMERFGKIESIDFFGHSSPFGALTESSGDNRTLNTWAPGFAGLADNFDRSRTPYMTLNGCNGGIETAPKLSKLLKIPVSGALTGSNFQELFDDGNFYIGDDGFFPSTLKRASINTKSFTANAGCWRGACVRMKPQDAPYRGVWARPDTGFQYYLNHYTFFCNYDDPQKTCEKGMTASLYAFLSSKPISAASPESDVKEVLADFFCTRSTDPTWFSRCRAGLEAAVANNTPFTSNRTAAGKVLDCDRAGCTQEFRCDKVADVPQKKSCVFVQKGCTKTDPSLCAAPNAAPKTTVAQYKAYLAGHALLK